MQVEGSDVLLRLSAERATGQPRMGRLITFENYDELYLRQVQIDQPLKSQTVVLDFRSVANLFSEFSRSDEEPDQGSSDTHNKPTDTVAHEPVESIGSLLENHSMSRMLAEEVKINIQPAHRKPITLTAGRATMGTDATLMKFEQSMQLQAAHCQITSAMAIWSSQPPGLYLPIIYHINGKRHTRAGFYQISSTGHCKAITPTPVIRYVDWLDKVEEKMVEAMPPSLRMLFSVMDMPAVPSK